MQNYNLQKFRLSFKNSKDECQRTLMILNNFDGIDEKNKKERIVKVIDIIKERKLKEYFKETFKHSQILQKYMKKTFLEIAQMGEGYLQKKGKLFGGNLIRPCFITSSTIGQIKNKDKSDSGKAYYF